MREPDNSFASIVEDQVSVDHERGRVQLFGKSFQVDPQLAPWIDMFLQWGMLLFYQHGGHYAREWTTKAAGTISPKSIDTGTAAKLGTAAELFLRFGGPTAQVVTNTIGTARIGYKAMRSLRDEASVLLAANHKDAAGGVLTANFSALAHKRAAVYEAAKRGVVGSAISALSQLPAVVIGYNQYQLERILNPAIAVNELPSNAPKEERDRIYWQYAQKQNRYQQQPEDAAADTVDPLQKLMPKELHSHPVAGILRSVSWLFSKRDRESMRNPQTEADYERNLENSTLMPPVVARAADWLRNKFISRKPEKTVAWDYIKEIESYVGHHRHQRPDRDKLAVMVKDVFEQHARDLGKKYDLDDINFENAVTMIASDLQYGKLHPQALAEILDNRKIVTFEKLAADFGDSEDVRAELDGLREKYSQRMSPEEFFKTANFTKAKLVATFNEIPEEEKPFFVLLVDPRVLKKAGVPEKDVDRYAQAGKDYFIGELTAMARYLIETGRRALKQKGVKGRLLDDLDALANGFDRADSSGNAEDFVNDNRARVSEIVRDIGVSANPGFWRAYIKDRAERGAQELDPPPALTSRRPLQRRTPLDMAETRDAMQEANR